MGAFRRLLHRARPLLQRLSQRSRALWRGRAAPSAPTTSPTHAADLQPRRQDLRPPTPTATPTDAAELPPRRPGDLRRLARTATPSDAAELPPLRHGDLRPPAPTATPSDATDLPPRRPGDLRPPRRPQDARPARRPEDARSPRRDRRTGSRPVNMVGILNRIQQKIKRLDQRVESLDERVEKLESENENPLNWLVEGSAVVLCNKDKLKDNLVDLKDYLKEVVKNNKGEDILDIVDSALAPW